MSEPMKIDDEMGGQVFPKYVPDIHGKSFEWVWHNKKEWVEFTRSWTTATGFYKTWSDFVKRKDVN